MNLDDSMEKYEELKEKLEIDKFDLDNELVQQPEYYHEVSENYALSMSLRDEAKDDMEKIWAEKDKEIREDAAAEGNKITENQISNQIKMDDDYITAQKYYIKAREATNKWSALKDSFHQRAHAMREVVTLWVSDYFQHNTVKTGSDKSKKAKSSAGREKMSKGRKDIKRRRSTGDD